MAINEKYRVNRFSTLIRIGGGGYKVLARLKHSRSRNHERIWAMYTKPRSQSELPFAIWLGRGYPLSPYLRAFIINFLLKEMKPRELKVAPDELFATEGVKDFLQCSLIRNFVKDWLHYVSWYWSVANSPDVCIGDFFKAPFYEP